MARSIELALLDDSPCWNCGETPSAALRRVGDLMVYARLCSSCWGEAAALEYPEHRKWFSLSDVKQSDRSLKEQNAELVAEWSRLTGSEQRIVSWPALSKVLKGVRRFYSQDEILEMLKVAAEDSFVQSEGLTLMSVLSGEMIAKWERGRGQKRRSDSSSEAKRLEVEKLRFLEEAFGCGKLTTELEQKVQQALTFEDLEGLNDERQAG